MDGGDLLAILPRVLSLILTTNGAHHPWTVTLSIGQPYTWVHRTIRYPRIV